MQAKINLMRQRKATDERCTFPIETAFVCPDLKWNYLYLRQAFAFMRSKNLLYQKNLVKRAQYEYFQAVLPST
jgi:hypothetical protein